MRTITVTATEFKAHCLKLMEGREEVVITKRGKVVARLKPEPARRQPLMGRWKGKVEEVGDIVHASMGDWEFD